MSRDTNSTTTAADVSARTNAVADTADHACDLQQICTARHWSIYWLLIFCSLAMISGRVMTLNHDADPYGMSKADAPFFSANDRSRWCTVRSLGDHGKYEIDDVISDPGNRFNWDTIDKVMHVGSDGQLHAYSSKPPLFPTIVAGLYQVIKQLTGKTITEDTTFVVRTILFLVNVVPWALYLWFLAKLLELIPARDWAKYFVVACAGFGTFLSTFSITLNNHSIAAVSVVAALYGLTRIAMGNKANKYFWLVGFAAAFATANELPALSFLAFAGVVCFVKSPVRTILGLVPAAAVVAAAFFGTNYLAHDDWRPPYAHRGDGAKFAELRGDFEDQLSKGDLPKELLSAADGRYDILNMTVEPAMWPGWGVSATNFTAAKRWIAKNDRLQQFTIVKVEDVENPKWQLHEWDNWYDYPGSYWLTTNQQKSNVDLGQTSREVYAFHILFGHHGIFSLTPLWLLSLAGMFVLLFQSRFQMRWFALMTIVISVVVVAFYIERPAHDRNYGGWTSGLRWLFWLAPLWLVSMVPIVEWLGKSSRGRMCCYGLLLISALSASYSLGNPWVHPWLFEIWDLSGLPK